MNADMHMMSQRSSGSHDVSGGGGGGDIHEAAKAGNLARVIHILEQLPDQGLLEVGKIIFIGSKTFLVREQKRRLLESHNSKGQTPLSCAAYYGQVQVVKYLINHFPDTYNAQDRDMSYPVHQAYLSKNLEVLKAFLCHAHSKRFMLQTNLHGETVLDMARKDGRDLSSLM